MHKLIWVCDTIIKAVTDFIKFIFFHCVDIQVFSDKPTYRKVYFIRYILHLSFIFEIFLKFFECNNILLF